MQQLPTFNFGLTTIFLFIYRTLSMRQKTKNYRIKGSYAKIFLFFPSHIPIRVWFVQKTRAKNSHAWAPLRSPRIDSVILCSLAGLYDTPFVVPARQATYRLAASIPWNRFLGSLNFYKFGLWVETGK